MGIPNKNTETIDWFLGTNLRYSEDIQLVYKEEQVLRLYYGLGPMPGSEEPFDVDGKNAWDGSSRTPGDRAHPGSDRGVVPLTTTQSTAR